MISIKIRVKNNFLVQWQVFMARAAYAVCHDHDVIEISSSDEQCVIFGCFVQRFGALC